jgi:hypothetical protein
MEGNNSELVNDDYESRQTKREIEYQKKLEELKEQHEQRIRNYEAYLQNIEIMSNKLPEEIKVECDVKLIEAGIKGIFMSCIGYFGILMWMKSRFKKVLIIMPPLLAYSGYHIWEYGYVYPLKKYKELEKIENENKEQNEIDPNTIEDKIAFDSSEKLNMNNSLTLEGKAKSSDLIDNKLNKKI